jgi:hypothetical protein
MIMVDVEILIQRFVGRGSSLLVHGRHRRVRRKTKGNSRRKNPSPHKWH